MAIVFSPCANVIAKAPPRACPDGPKFLSITVDGQDMYTNGLLTGVSISATGNYQFLHTVSNFIYLYAFGDRISILSLTGMGFVKNCEGAENTQLQKIYDFYKSKRIAKKTQPLDIVISGVGAELSFKFTGYLTGMNIDLKNSDPLGTVGFWNMKFEAVID